MKMRTMGNKILVLLLVLAFPSFLFAKIPNAPYPDRNYNGNLNSDGSPNSVDGTSDYSGPRNKAAAISDSSVQGSFPNIAKYYTGIIYSVFRTLCISYVIIFGIFLGVAIAFGQAADEEIRNYFMGSIVVYAANILASFYINFLS